MNFYVFIFLNVSCCFRFSGVHLETTTGEKKERFIVVTRVKSEDELKKKEKEKQAKEIVRKT